MSTWEHQDWGTPWPPFYALDKEFGFTIDGAASAENTKVDRLISEEQDAIDPSLSDEVVFAKWRSVWAAMPCLWKVELFETCNAAKVVDGR